ncbi:adenine-specific DNA-methyltransferase [Streptococcus gallolyticus]|uniref:Adenine-specific DNA-methyltransferase n=1 Tax=Streptococcus gallolyticus TaxID=315405 RepID=A0A1H7U777_9STRE|nr:site-specific DNA-methyltransferase [Streptococcus gallolyticus]SEF19672.1 adenine-specific DNA-methyltransferase [Streptococcus gallolyticus]SEL92910.1 adenine-specific DNA-methyltransferase [Streptococcus gallolyticus]
MPSTFNERPHQNEKAEALEYISKLIDDAREKSDNEAIPKLENLLRLVNGKRYGLVWEEHAELVDEKMKTEIPVFVEDETKKIVGNPDSQDYNFLLEGDNLHSLHLLEKTHSGKIDVIYIDPPYNTGSKSEDSNGNFIYNDHIVDSKDGYRHSKWLSFMDARLQIAMTLLSSKGVIFISIGKEEVAQLKLLCDEIFGEQNCLGQIVRRTKTTSFRGNYFAPRVDYILCYSSGKEAPDKFMDLVDPKDYKKVEKNGERIGELYKDDTAFYLSTLETRPNQRYYIECPDGELVIPPGKTFPSSNIDGSKAVPEQNDGVWRWEASQYFARKDLLVFKKSKRSPLLTSERKKSKWNIYTKSYYLDKKNNGNIPTELLLEQINRKGTSELKKLKIRFTFPKPSSLIKYLIQITNKNKDILVLDFFAGSGSTGHAVEQLNKEDGGNRRYILCTNNENNICEEVTYKRLKNIQDDLPHNLKYFKTKFISKDDEDLEYTLLNNVKTLIELEHGIDLEESDKATAFTLSEIRNLDLTGIKTVYVRQHSHAMMKKGDLARFKGIELVDVPEYYFAKEMREAGL